MSARVAQWHGVTVLRNNRWTLIIVKFLCSFSSFQNMWQQSSKSTVSGARVLADCGKLLNLAVPRLSHL